MLLARAILRAAAALFCASSAACAAPGDRAPIGARAQAETATTGWSIAEAGDLNGDGRADALWNNPERNVFAVWLIQGAELYEPGPEIPGPPGGGWVTPSDSDFNGDGFIDVLWDHAGANEISVYLMRGTRLLEPGPNIPGPRGAGWAAAASGDANGDGFADAVLYNSLTNRIVIYLMRGTHLVEAGPEIPGPPGDGWSVVTNADFNGDGFQDVLLYNANTQHVCVYLMRGTHVVEPGPEIPGPPGDGWIATTAADTNLDGMADVVWHNPLTNRAAIWLMRGTHLLEPGPEIPGPPGDGWRLTGSGDADGDGMADLYWYNNHVTTRMAIWLMRGTRLLAPGREMPGPP
jgi:hypothetical protein